MKMHAIGGLLAIALAAGFAAQAQEPDLELMGAIAKHKGFVWEPVTSSGVHFFTNAIIHSTRATPSGQIQRSTETVELTGDIVGRVLYHPVSVFNFVDGTLVNTGHQVFSGTVLGGAPVMLHDDEFRFEIDLNTGATVGEVHLVDRIAGRRTRCHLKVTGTGVTPEGNAMFDYVGKCKIRSR